MNNPPAGDASVSGDSKTESEVPQFYVKSEYGIHKFVGALAFGMSKKYRPILIYLASEE